MSSPRNDTAVKTGPFLRTDMQVTVIKHCTWTSIRYMHLYLILFEVCPDSPAFVIGQCVSVFLEKRVDTGNSSVPRIFQIF